MSESAGKKRWGMAPWAIDFRAVANLRGGNRAIPDDVDFAIVGGGFTGLAAAACLRRMDASKSVVVFEAETIGAGASGHTGGMCLGETAVGDLPGLGDVLSGFSGLLRELEVDCDLSLPGASELGRAKGGAASAIHWNDSGDLHVVKEVAGGTIDPGKMVSGLAHAAEESGAMIFENARVENVEFESGVRLQVAGRMIRARRVLFATNAQSLELSGLAASAQSKFTLALATEPLSDEQVAAIGLASRKPFYTVDFPYLWGRLLNTNGVIFGSGLVHFNDWREVRELEIDSAEAGELMRKLETRVRRLHPALRNVTVTHRWGGPILVGAEWQPIFARHPRSADAFVLGAYSGHGVALSVYLGNWAAEVMLGRRELPKWDAVAECGTEPPKE
jgi:glycine/D-amino acid oxidase-like deaminating enzyme